MLAEVGAMPRVPPCFCTAAANAGSTLHPRTVSIMKLEVEYPGKAFVDWRLAELGMENKASPVR